MESEQEFLTLAQVAERLQVSTQTVRDWIAKGRLSALQLDRAFRVRREDLEAMIAARTTQARLPEASPWDDITVSTTQGVKRP